MADDQTVTVRALRFFRGQPGEGVEGMVSPGDTLHLSRSRSAELKANDLVSVLADAAPDAPLAAQVTASEEEAAPPTKKAK